MSEHGTTDSNAPRMCGAPEKRELGEEKKQELIDHALKKFHEVSSSLYTHQAVNLTDWTSQVVAGVKYVLTLEVAETTHRKDNSNAAEERKLKYGPEKNLVCKISVYQRPWEKFTETSILEVTNKQGEPVSAY